MLNKMKQYVDLEVIENQWGKNTLKTKSHMIEILVTSQLGIRPEASYSQVRRDNLINIQ
jgi:hypothetical protein